MHDKSLAKNKKEAKRVPPNSGNGQKPKSKPIVTTTADSDDISDIFSSIKAVKKKESAPATTAAPLPQKKTQKRDGLYRAPEKSIELPDSEFFVSGKFVSAKGIEKGKTPIGTASAEEDTLSKSEGVNRIISMDELQTMISKNPRAGTTPNCPFDCDCCF
ncbi:hypothetical protein AGDE_08688 [Angomonas deanei]|uniref:Uncharacterized protein n=1 Tax=Angomonas deanei TaxID=59799 RepID=A0A7G2CF97_9TRYP|nr:hypothetical protein AGDE_08688 [Angomonas deanei]CAD2216802.1 Eukaryotic protein of unknown function (DUF1764), putative [Angomonas deanei]|eukprot:EPY32445.1 hypothetical protein AGDE_08688 [Angomonas deanei]